MIELLRGVWRFRGFIAASVKREFASRYRGTQLGVLWPLAHPLALVAIYTLVFSGLMRAQLPGHDSRFAYSIYLTAGLVVWSLFSELLLRSVGIFVQNAEVLKKVSVHKLAFPAIAFLSALVQSAILLGAFLVFLVVTGNLPGAPILAVPVVLGITSLLAMGLGLFLATINVFYRDVEQGTSLALQFGFWMTPIVYPASTLPPAVARILEWNPLWAVVRAFQAIFLENRFPDWGTLAYPLGLAVVLALLARSTFERLSRDLVDEL